MKLAIQVLIRIDCALTIIALVHRPPNPHGSSIPPSWSACERYTNQRRFKVCVVPDSYALALPGLRFVAILPLPML